MKMSKTFILAGDAFFTVECPPGCTHPHLTYRVVRVEANGRYPEAFFARLLAGPDNTSDYSYLGKLDPYTGQVTPTAKSQVDPRAVSFRLLNRVLARIWADDHEAYERSGYRVHHAGRCCRCGRLLTRPDSIELGIGPECAEIMGLTPRPVRKETAPGDADLREACEKAGIRFTSEGGIASGEKGLVDAAVAELEARDESGFVSDGLSVAGLTPVRDREGEITHWTGYRNGRKVEVFND